MSKRQAPGAGGKPRLILNQRVCDRCGRCVQACDQGAVRVGRTYLAVDWARCDGCGACVRVCAPGAISAGKGSAVPARVKTPKPVARPRSGGRGTKTVPTKAHESPAKTRGAKASKGFADEPSEGPTEGVAALETKTQAAAAATASAETSPAQGAVIAKTGSRGGFQWTLLEAVAMLSVTFSAFMVKELINASRFVNTMPSGLGIASRVAVLAAYYAVQVVLLVWLVRRRGGDPLAALGLRTAGTSRREALTSAWLVVGGLVLTRLIASIYAFVTRELGMMPSTGVDLPALFGSNTVGVLLAVLMVVLVGPAVEEAVFRGALLEGLAARFGAWPAIIAQAALFAAFHRSWWLLFPTFVLGVVLGWLAHARQSLWPPIALHALYNALTVAAAFVVPVGS